MGNSNIIESLTFTVPLSLLAFNIAQKFSQKQFSLEKAQQVYHNILAVRAVDFYLQCMGLETDLESSDSHDIVMQTFTDVADIEVKNYGKLECRSVFSDQGNCYVPPDVWSDRIGYIFVYLNESLKQAKIIGFTSTVTEKQGIQPLSDLRSLLEFPEYLNQIKSQSKVETTAIKLSNWLNNIFEPNWQSLEDFLGISPSLVANYAALRTDDNFEDSSTKRIKLIDLGLQIKDLSLALLVGLKPEADNKVAIRVQLRPSKSSTNLPPNVKLALLSSSGSIIQEVDSREQDNYIQLKRWKSKTGTKFTIRVSVNDLSLTEDFEV